MRLTAFSVMAFLCTLLGLLLFGVLIVILG
jgi:hypothetical protein